MRYLVDTVWVIHHLNGRQDLIQRGATVDNALLLHRNLDILKALHDQTQDGLQQVSLQFKPRKTRLTHTLHFYNTVHRAHDTGYQVEELV